MSNNSHNLKSLQSEKKRTENLIANLKSDCAQIQRQISGANKEIARIDAEIAKLSKRQIVISEHCIIRYFERVLGYDLDEIKSKILAEHQQHLRITDGVATTLIL